MIMTLMGMGLMMQALKGSAIASGRKDSGKVGAISEGGVSRTLALLKQPQNAALLTRHYDPINPRTGRTYLGADGALNSGDESTAAVDEWTGYDPSTLPCYQQAGVGAPNLPLTGTIGGGNYTIRAYRYDTTQQAGVVLVEGTYANQSSVIAVTFTLNPFLDNFPGLVAARQMTGGQFSLRRRVVLGRNSNIYFSPSVSADPSVSGMSAPGDATRPTFLNAIYASTTQDGATGDDVDGKIYACQLQQTPSPPSTPAGAILIPPITTTQTLSGSAGQVTHYVTDSITLTNNDTLSVDTTAGPVYIWIEGPTNNKFLRLQNNAKVLNIRTDGSPPRVGDLHITTANTNHFRLVMHLEGQSCIQDAIVYDNDGLGRLYTTGPGCPSGRNTNFEGVLWLEEIHTAKDTTANRDISPTSNVFPQSYPPTPGVSSGYYVPDDVTSLINMLPNIGLPTRYQFGQIKSWKRQRL